VVDVNVGRLAKWLRALGYDAVFVPDVDDGGLVNIAQREGRVVLTKDGRMLERRVFTTGQLKAIHIRSDRYAEQVRQVVEELGLDTSRYFTRCIECNVPFVALPKEQARQRIPPFVFQTQEEFMECPTCHKVYWRGTHWKNMRAELAQALRQADASQDAGKKAAG